MSSKRLEHFSVGAPLACCLARQKNRCRFLPLIDVQLIILHGFLPYVNRSCTAQFLAKGFSGNNTGLPFTGGS